MEIVTNILSPAGSYDLVTLEAAKAELGLTDIGDDTYLQIVISQVSQVVATYCGRVFAAETVQDSIFFTLQGQGHNLHQNFGGGYPYSRPNHNWITLSRAPVISLTSVSTGENMYTTSDYMLDKAAGRVLMFGGFFAIASDPLVITYQSGFATIPADVAAAVSRLVVMRYKQRGRDPLLVATGGEPGLGGQRWWVGTQPGSDGAIPPEVAGMLAPYRRPGIS